jgi:septal ring-binding cell division protein DamX
VKVFIQKFLYSLVLSFAGFGLYFGWMAAKEFLGKNMVEKAEVVQKVSPVKPDYAHNHPVYSMQAIEKDEFTFFDTLVDPAMEKMVGLNGNLLSSGSSKSDTRRDEYVMPMPAMIKKVNIKPRIIKFARPATGIPLSLPEKQVKSFSAESGRFTVQVSSFRDRKYATGLVSKLKQKGYPAFVIAIQLSNGQTWYRVNIGRYPDHDSAQISAMKVQMSEALKTMVIAFSG